MDTTKPWRWRRKSTEKTLEANTRTSLSLETIFVQDQDNDAESLKCPSNLSDRLLPSVTCDCSSIKDELIRKHRRIAEQALAGQEMERAEAAYLKEELDKALQQEEIAEKKLANLNAALQECSKEIELIREQHEETVRNAVFDAKSDCDTEMKRLEGKLVENNLRISNLAAENANLMKALICRERLVRDLDKRKEEVESECLELRDLVRKKSNQSFLIEKIYSLEEENVALREIVALSDSELQSWRIKYGEMGSRLVELEAEIQALSAGENSMQLAISGLELGNTDVIIRENTVDFRQECKDIVAVSTESRRNRVGFGDQSSWLDEVLMVLLDEQRVSNRDVGDLLEDIRITLGCDRNQISEATEICGLLTWEKDDASFSREKMRKNNVGFDRSKSDVGLLQFNDSENRHNTLAQMIAIQSTLQDENRRMEETLRRVNAERAALRTEAQQLKQKVEGLQKEVGSSRESKGLMEDQVENQRLINEDLNTQLTVAKAKLNEITHKLSSLEVELDHRNNCCDELESTCLELQLQLETVSRKESPKNTFIDAVAKQLFDQARCAVTAIEVDDKKSLQKGQGYSLRDRLMSEQLDEKSIVAYTGSTPPLPVPPEQTVSLAVVSSNKASNKGFGFIRKLFLRRKKGCSKTKPGTLQRNASKALLVV